MDTALCFLKSYLGLSFLVQSVQGVGESRTMGLQNSTALPPLSRWNIGYVGILFKHTQSQILST